MKEIGGYFELELNDNEEYHKDTIRLNTGRNALEYILLANKYTKLFLPFFTCDVLLQPLKKNQIEYEFYCIDENLEPKFDFCKIKATDGFLYTNYFGLKDSFIRKIAADCRNLIVDNAQSFFSKPLKGINTFYSVRKFFGVSDGAYVFSNSILNGPFQQDVSYERFDHLLRRLDVNAEHGYPYFSKNDQSLNNLPILAMSKLTKRLLRSIDYSSIASKRRNNYLYLNDKLSLLNNFPVKLDDIQIPLDYPYLAENATLRKKLIENKIFTPKYWPNVPEKIPEGSLEQKYIDQIFHLPIDQRYSHCDMDNIVKLILKYG